MIGADVRPGDAFSGAPKRMSLPRLLMFSGGPIGDPDFPKPNIHTDDATAKEAGLPGVCASGTQYQGALVELMIDLFGEGWLAGGRLAVKLVDLVLVDQTVHAKAVVRETEGSTVHLDVWCARDDGGKVLVGTASGRVPG